jgi:hypothetical protein
MHLIISLITIWLLLISPILGQVWSESALFPLPEGYENLNHVTAASWEPGIYLLDDLRLEVVLLDATGAIQNRYGGWGTGPLLLDLPKDLVVGENSVFVLDMGGPRILRLDMRLNPVSETPLPAEFLPRTFIRDNRQRFWVSFEDLAGLYLYNDDGRLLDVVADETSGMAVLRCPLLLARSSQGIAVWDPVAATVSLFRFSGQLYRRLPIGLDTIVLDIEWLGNALILATPDGIWHLDLETGDLGLIFNKAGFVDLTSRERPSALRREFRLYGLNSQKGVLSVLEQVP